MDTDKFESLFGTEIKELPLPTDVTLPDDYAMFAPDKSSSWQLPKADSLDTLIDRANIQHPPIFFADERPLPPLWPDKFRLRVPVDVAQLTQAASVHKRGFTGNCVKVVMPDTEMPNWLKPLHLAVLSAVKQKIPAPLAHLRRTPGAGPHQSLYRPDSTVPATRDVLTFPQPL